jgi:hypothetical protein
MLLSFSTLVASQLFMTVADDVPKFDVARGCKGDNTNTSQRCVQDEQRARDQLQSQWSQFTASDRIMCIGEAKDISSVPPSYVDLLSCLQTQQFAKKPKN